MHPMDAVCRSPYEQVFNNTCQMQPLQLLKGQQDMELPKLAFPSEQVRRTQMLSFSQMPVRAVPTQGPVTMGEDAAD
jgi:hypothetical protein